VVIALTAGAAPQIRRGQRIRLWASTPSCPLVTVLPDATVQDVSAGASGGFGTAGSQRVVVLPGNDLAARVVAAQALSGVSLRAAVLDGPADPLDTAALADLSACESQ
jgi:hypothetical protein